MPRDATDCRVICPYYLSHSYVHIHCLWLGGRVLTQRFPSALRRIRHINRYCASWSYRRCPLAAIMEAGYERKAKGSAPGPRQRDASLWNPCIGEEKGQEDEMKP